MPERKTITRISEHVRFYVDGQEWKTKEFLIENTSTYVTLWEVGPSILTSKGRNIVVTPNAESIAPKKGFFCNLHTNHGLQDHFFLAVYLGKENNKHVFKIVEETETAEEREKGYAGGLLINDVGLDVYSKLGISTYNTAQLEQELISRNSKVRMEFPYIERYKDNDKLDKIRDILNEY